MRCRCPFCVERTGSRGNRPFGQHVSVDMSTGFFKCFRCGARGRVTKRVAELLGIDFDRISFSSYEKEEPKRADVSVDGFVPLKPTVVSERSLALGMYTRYLVGRGIDHSVIDLYNIGVLMGAKFGKHYRGAYAFPTYDNKFPGYVYRLRVGGYRSPGIKRSLGALYDGDQIDSTSVAPLYVVEGPLDRLAIYPCKAVATYGKDITDKQMERIATCNGPVIFALDGDAWVDSSVYAMSLTLLGHRESRWVKLPSGRDPGNIGLGILDLEQREV